MAAAPALPEHCCAVHTEELCAGGICWHFGAGDWDPQYKKDIKLMEVI